MIISPPFLPAPEADDEAFVRLAMPDAVDIAPHSGGAPLGSYPLTTALTWHNGLHIDAPRNVQAPITQSPAAQVPLRLPVRAIADGTVIFKREPKPANTSPADPQNYNPYGSEPAWSDNGIVIVRHTTDIGASGNASTSLSYYSVYMHLSRIEPTVVEKQPIWRKDAIGTAGRILGREHQIHFEICLNAAELQKLLGAGRPLTWRDPATAPTADGRTDSVFGSVYVYLPAGTPTSAGAPVSHLRGAAVAGTLQEAQWVEIRYRNGSAKVSSYRATEGADGSPVGTPIGQSHPEPDFEYNLYAEANRRHNSLGAAVQATSSPSGWYELLRFGRNLGPDPLPGNAAHWRQIPTASGTVWADLNAPGTFKFSDADFPAFLGWQCYDDDPSADNQRCDSLQLKRAIRDPQVPESIRQRAVLARRLGDAGVRSTFRRAICKFPTEWDRSTIAKRYEWLKTDDEYRVEPGKGWEEFEAHCKAITFDDLPEEYKAATWHLHPRTFISHMRMCGWLSEKELARALDTAPTTGQTRANSLRTPMNTMLRKYGLLLTRQRAAHFFAQVGHETGWWQYREELGNERYFRTMYELITSTEAAADYRSGLAQRLNLVRSGESEQAYSARRPSAVVIKAASMDNGQANAASGGASGDGPRFRGRGFLQITGRRNYSSYGKFRGHDFTTDPNPVLLASNDFNACDASGFYWSRERTNAEADVGTAASNVTRVGASLIEALQTRRHCMILSVRTISRISGGG